MTNWLYSNKEWIFSGIGIALISAAFAFWKKKTNRKKAKHIININGSQNIIGNGNTVKVMNPAPPKRSTIKIVDIFLVEDEDFIVDIKLRNIGDEVAFLKKVVFDIHDYYSMENPQITHYQLVESSCTYDLVLDDREQQVFNISQSIGTNEVDRFRIKIASSIAEAGMAAIYYLSLSFIYDEDDKIESSGKFLWAVPSNQEWAGCYVSDFDFEIAKRNYLKLVELNQYKAVKDEQFIQILDSYEQNKSDFLGEGVESKG